MGGGSNVLHGKARGDMLSTPDKKRPCGENPVLLDLEGMSDNELALHLAHTKKYLKDRSDVRKAASKKQKLTAKAAEKEVGRSLVPPPPAANTKKRHPVRSPPSCKISDLQAIGARRPLRSKRHPKEYSK